MNMVRERVTGGSSSGGTNRASRSKKGWIILDWNRLNHGRSSWFVIDFGKLGPIDDSASDRTATLNGIVIEHWKAIRGGEPMGNATLTLFDMDGRAQRPHFFRLIWKVFIQGGGTDDMRLEVDMEGKISEYRLLVPVTHHRL